MYQSEGEYTMVLYTARVHKKPMVFGLIALVVMVVGFLVYQGTGTQEVTPEVMVLTTAEERIAYLADKGWQVAEPPLETLDFLLPNPLTLAYLTYNELQLVQGFDLMSYAGQGVTRYTYAVDNYPGRNSGVQLNLYLHEGVVIAGDIICPGADGFQATLVYPVEN